MNDQRLVTKARFPIWPPQSQVMTMNLKRHNSHFKTFHVFDKVLVCFKFSYLNERALAAVPDDALNSALRTLLEPGPQLLEVHWWTVSYSNAPMWHEEVDRLLLTPHSC